VSWSIQPGVLGASNVTPAGVVAVAEGVKKKNAPSDWVADAFRNREYNIV
jgi:hypothetical protein